VPLEERRERIVQLLSRHVAADHLTLEEFERRVDIAHRTRTLAELDALLGDLPALERPAAPAASARRVGATNPAPEERRFLVAIMGGTERRGAWTPARHNTVFAFMGGAELDFRDARMAPGVTELTIIAMFGGVELIVPPDLPVEANGVAIMGGFAHAAEEPRASADPNAPRLRINGLALMGGVDIQVRLPGESAGDARRRKRQQRRQLLQEEKQRLREQRRALRDRYRGGEW
jgi:hypothetical protein